MTWICHSPCTLNKNLTNGMKTGTRLAAPVWHACKLIAAICGMWQISKLPGPANWVTAWRKESRQIIYNISSPGSYSEHDCWYPNGHGRVKNHPFECSNKM